MASCSEEPLPQAPLRSDDCLRQLTLDQLGAQLKRCDEVVAAFPHNPAPLNDRYVLRTLMGPEHEQAACDDIRKAAALAAKARPGKLDPQLRAELKLRLGLCQEPRHRQPTLTP